MANTTTTAKKVVEPQEKVKLTVSGVLADLKSGLDRDQIGVKYGLNKANVSRLFKHEKLRGKRVAPADAFILEDDTEEQTQEKIASVAEEAKAIADEQEAKGSGSEGSGDQQAKVETKKGMW